MGLYTDPQEAEDSEKHPEPRGGDADGQSKIRECKKKTGTLLLKNST